MAKVTCLPDEKTISVSATETLLQASLREGLPHTHACGGHARCTTCRVMILEGESACLPPNEAEKTICEKLSFPSNIRLACQTKVTGDVTLRRLILDKEDIELVKNMKARLTPVSLGKEKELAILFVDIAGFTSFAEKHFSYDVIHVLNRYFQEMERIVLQHKGTINNMMGDGFLALFDVDEPVVSALSAVKAGLFILEEMKNFNHYLESLYKEQLSLRIGIHYGPVIMGTIGQREAVIGDSVNLASRIESVNKEMGTSLLVSETVYEKVKGQIVFGKDCRGSIRGKKGSYHLYEAIGVA